MPLTLAQLRPLLQRHVGQGLNLSEALNLVVQELLPRGNWRDTKVVTRFRVYEDRYGNNIVTLPRELEHIIVGAYENCNPDTAVAPGAACGSRPIPVRNEWYAYAPSGPGNLSGTDGLRGIVRQSGRYTTFIDWDEAKFLRLKFEETEGAGTVLFKGRLAGAKIYTDGSEGVGLDYTGTATVTTTKTFDEPPYAILKPKTNGRVKLYAVNPDDSNDETLAGYYEPDEMNPSYTRYRVPACVTTAS